MHKTFRDIQRKPIYLITFFILVAILSSEFSSLGMTGIFFAVAIAGGIIGGSVFVFKAIAIKTNEMLDGKPGEMEHLLAPGGYRRKRYKETWDEYAAQSAVAPTPNRPLARGDIVEAPSRPARTAIGQTRAITRTATHTPTIVTPPQQLAITNSKQWLNAYLELAANFNPKHNKVIGRGITCIGMRGSGKSNVAALLLEQIWKLPVIPGVAFDYKLDFASLEKLLPNCRIGGLPTWPDAERYTGYWGITVKNAKEVGYEVRERGAQLIVQLSSYPDMDTQAEIMSGIIAGMFAWAQDHRDNPLPAIVLLDEAQQFLPQSLQDSSISRAILQELFRNFKQLNEIGRSFGLQPMFFTQRAARINKDVIGGTEIWILMKQTMPQDLAACDDLLGEKVDRAQITGFNAGDALVYESGQSFFVHFDQRQSVHLNRTPTLQDAVKHYGNTQVPGRLTTTLLDDEEEDTDIEDASYPADDNDPLVEEQHPTRAPIAIVKRQGPTLLERGINAYLEGGTSQSKLAAKLDITAWEARNLMPKVIEAVQQQQSSENA